MKHAPAPKASSSRPELSDHAAYDAAKKKLAQLKASLEETISRRDGHHAIVRRRAGPDARRYLASSPRVLPTMTDAIFDEICSKVIEAAGSGVPAPLMARLQYQVSKPHFSDSNDMNIIAEVEETEAAVQLLKRAVSLAEDAVAREKNLAIAEILKSVRSERETISGAVAAILLQLVAALQDEHEFVDRLRVQDEGIPDDNEQSAVFLGVPTPKPAPGLIRPDAAQNRACKAQ